MLNSLRKFSNSIYAKFFLGIVILPFVFWGMGDIFSSGKTNTIATIDGKNIPSSEFTNYLNGLNLNSEDLKDQMFEKSLNDFIGIKLINSETEKFEIDVTDLSLIDIVKNNEMFMKDNKFIRTKYEKYLISNNLVAPQFENLIRSNERRKQLIDLISGGIKSPNFLINREFNFVNQVKNLLVINLNDLYEKDLNFSEKEIGDYYKKNIKKFSENFRSVKYTEITPKSLTGNEEYNNIFFKKLDEIDDSIASENNIQEISDQFNLNIKTSQLFNKNGKNVNGDVYREFQSSLIKNIFEIKTSNPLVMIGINSSYFLLQLHGNEQIKKKITDSEVRDKILIGLRQEKIIYRNSEFIEKILKREFKKSDFENLALKNDLNIEKIKLNNIKDDKKFNKELVSNIYLLPEKNMYVFSDSKLIESFLVYNNETEKVKIAVNDKEYEKYMQKSNLSIINNIYNSYNEYINKKYKVEINYKALESIKNYFR